MAKGIALLCHSDTRVRFVSMVGADAAGAEFRQGLAAAGVEPLLLESVTGLPTSTCLCMVRSALFEGIEYLYASCAYRAEREVSLSAG